VATILVVDDESIILSLCTSILKIKGHTVLTAASGEQAFRVLEESKAAIDLALLDIMMPGLNGIQLAAQIRLANPKIPVILMTGFTLREIQEIIGEANPYRIIWKPFKTESLLQMIENALEGQALVTPGTGENHGPVE
jgi:CheY-like chemotaxis protein